MEPKATVWLPSYRHAPYLPAAIDSVLAQTLPDVELVLVEDGSDDDSLQIAEGYAARHPQRITVLTHPGHANRGVAASARLALEHARGPYLLGLASDDMLYPDALERALAFLERHPQVGFVYGYAHLIDATGRRLTEARTFGIDITRGGRALERLVQGNTIPSMTATLRRECVDAAGAHNPELVYSDWEFFVRAAAHCDVGFIGRPMAAYRIHETNTSFQSREVTLLRSLDVTAFLRDNSTTVGGRLAEPRVRALLELQMAFLLFACCEEGTAVGHLAAALEQDPTLRADARWLGDWTWSRVLDRLLPDDERCFARWVELNLAPLLEPATARRLRRTATAVHHGERAAKISARGHSAAAVRAALRMALHAPGRAIDRRLAAVLLDAAPNGVAARGARRTKRLLQPGR